MAVHPLRPATRRRLGRPLPHQPADRTRAPPPSHCCFNLSAYGVLASVSKRCPPLKDRFSCCTHPSATQIYNPCYHFSYIRVQLACVTHAASVCPEPGSNSQLLFSLKLAYRLCAVFFYQVAKNTICSFNLLPERFVVTPFGRQEIIYHGIKKKASTLLIIFQFLKKVLYSVITKMVKIRQLKNRKNNSLLFYFPSFFFAEKKLNMKLNNPFSSRA